MGCVGRGIRLRATCLKPIPATGNFALRSVPGCHYSDGKWTDEKTDAVIPDGTIVRETLGEYRLGQEYRLEQEDGVGKIVALDGVKAQAKNIRISDAGTKISASDSKP